ncbi:hypothetical protein Tco_0059899 [Tanacetum coccineum]
MVDTCTIAELLQEPTEGYGDAIVIPAILAENFELKHGLLNLVTSKQFCGFEKEYHHAHIRWFNKITSTIKYKDVSNSSIKLMLFPFSIEGAARIWLEKEPPRSISKVRTSRNRPVVAKGSTNTSTSGLSPDVVVLTDAVKALLLKNTTPPQASVKVVEESYQDNIQAYVSAATVNYNQGNTGHRPLSVGVSYDGPPIPPPFSSSPKVVEREPEVTKDPVQPSIEKVQPPDVQPQAPTSEPDIAPKPKPNLPYPSRLNNQKL